jgi:Cu-processing system ATP-binding protein
MIYIQDLNKTFGRLQALKGLSLDLMPSRVYALVGPNGSGKTTLLKCILGLVIPGTGRLEVGNESVRNHWQYRKKLGYMPQIGRYPGNMTIGQLFDMVSNLRKEETQRDEELYFSFRLDEMRNKRMHTLSGGTRQKVSAALAFLFNPPVLILDEPTAGLDPVSVEILKDKILREKESGKLIVISSHILSDLDELATHLVYLYEGDLIYNDSIVGLKAETGEEKLGKAIAHLLKTSMLNSNPT